MQKKKLLDFLSGIGEAVSQQTTQALQQVKIKPVVERHPDNFATPTFAHSEKEISDIQQPSQSDAEPPPNDEVQEQAAFDHESSRTEELQRVPPLPEHVRSASVVTESGNLNLASVLTQRSDVESPGVPLSGSQRKKTKLSDIEEEKLRIQQQLKSIEAQIDHLKEPQKQNSNPLPASTFKKYKEISQDAQAFSNAQKLMSKLHADKRAQQEKREQQQRERLQQLEREAIEKEAERQQQLERVKRQRREQIARRIEEDQRRRQQRRIIDQQSNQLIKEIKKEMKPVSTSLEVRELEHKKKLLEKKRNFDLADIEQHQLRYKEMKLQRSIHRSEEPHVAMSLPRYPKGKFLEMYEQEQHTRKEEERLKEEERRANVEKRLKYGELVKKIFLPPKPPKKEEETASKIKPPTPDVVVNGAFKQEVVTRKTYTNSHDAIHKSSLRQRLPELAKVTNSSSLSKHVSGRESVEPVNEIQFEQKQRRLVREKQVRRQTKQRLKHAEERDKQRKQVQLPKVKKYENYLAQLPRHKQDSNLEWKKIIDNEGMSKEQKYKELMSKANLMENKARFKEEMAGGSHENEQAMNLIIGSIQAKLALLDKF